MTPVPNEKPLVLIVEDDTAEQSQYRRLLGNTVKTLSACNIAAGKQAILNHQDGKNVFSIVVMDGRLENNIRPDSLELIRMLRDGGFSGPIIAASSSKYFREKMKLAGCSHESQKKDIPWLVLKIISETKE